MMNKLLLIAGLALVAGSFFLINSYTQQDIQDSVQRFNEYKKNFNKKYSSSEDYFRYLVYVNNMQEADTHNSNPENTWVMGETQFSDLTSVEFAALYLVRDSEGDQINAQTYEDMDFISNGAVDWRSESGVSTHVKNQGQCGSCWAFAAVAGVEAYLAVVKGQRDLDLSEQQLVDCSRDSSDGCDGGTRQTAIQWVADNGLVNQAAYPYTARQVDCQIPNGPYKINGPVRVNPDVASHQSAATLRPFTAGVDATNWSQYRGGIMNNCNNQRTNHAITVFGYEESGNWIIKNSWSTLWGEEGFIRLAPGNTCAVMINSWLPA